MHPPRATLGRHCGCCARRRRSYHRRCRWCCRWRCSWRLCSKERRCRCRRCWSWSWSCRSGSRNSRWLLGGLNDGALRQQTAGRRIVRNCRGCWEARKRKAGFTVARAAERSSKPGDDPSKFSYRRTNASSLAEAAVAKSRSWELLVCCAHSHRLLCEGRQNSCTCNAKHAPGRRRTTALG